MTAPTRRQIMQMADKAGIADYNAAARLVRLALEAFRPAPVPVPVSERLPEPSDCDGQGRCWLLSKVENEWRLVDVGNLGVPRLKYCFSHWLPANDLPLPAGEEE